MFYIHFSYDAPYSTFLIKDNCNEILLRTIIYYCKINIKSHVKHHFIYQYFNDKTNLDYLEKILKTSLNIPNKNSEYQVHNNMLLWGDEKHMIPLCYIDNIKRTNTNKFKCVVLEKCPEEYFEFIII